MGDEEEGNNGNLSVRPRGGLDSNGTRKSALQKSSKESLGLRSDAQ